MIRHVVGLPVSLSFALSLAATIAAAPRPSHPSLTLEGKLASVQGEGPVLHTVKKDFRLASKELYLMHTLEDKRLSGRELRLVGTENPDGSFNVEKLFTVRAGRLYRVRYYCEVCNVEALEPGRCVCCQQPTELQEIPIDGN